MIKIKVYSKNLTLRNKLKESISYFNNKFKNNIQVEETEEIITVRYE